MPPSSKFSVAIHTLTLLGIADGKPMTSEEIARSVNTNAVVIRRLLCLLAEAKLVECQSGKFGGCRLAKKPEKISLLDIYRAVEPNPLFTIHKKPEKKDCPVSCSMKSVLMDIFENAESAALSQFKGKTLRDLLQSFVSTSRRSIKS